MVVESPERSVRKEKAARNRKFDPSARPIWEIFAEISAQIPAEDWQQVPADASINYRHYLRGTPRVED